MARLGIRGFKTKLRKAAEKLEELRTGAGEPLPPNTLAELRRDMAQLRFVADQIKQIEKAREARLAKAPRGGVWRLPPPASGSPPCCNGRPRRAASPGTPASAAPYRADPSWRGDNPASPGCSSGE
ncbi:MAG: hypothetical protein WAL59_02840 [Roseiarcus sp.]